MLERLIIENIALIERMDVELGSGFTVLTGETGAGKSIIIDAVNLALGSRASRELISYGKQKARVEAFFNIGDTPAVVTLLDELEIPHDDEMLSLVREITVQGRSTCRVNGVVVQLSALKVISSLLVDVHGQHEHQSLLDEKNHIGVIDSHMADEIRPLVEKVGRIYEEHAGVCSELNSGHMSEAERERRIDILNYQIKEISKAELSPDEEDEILDELKVLANSERISDALNGSMELFNGDHGAVGIVRDAADALNDISKFSTRYSEVAERLDNLYYELEDISYAVRDLSLSAEYDPHRLNLLESRLDVINTLKHKYGRTVAEVLTFKAEAEAELARLTGSAEIRAELIKRRDAIASAYFDAASRLTSARKRSAQMLCELAEAQLKMLGMKNARLEAEFSVPDGDLHPNGVDDAAFMLSANAGEPPKPLSKVASGGELSRIMLALKTVISDADGIPTLIFDEVDTGISGSTANTVGQRMALIAKRHQVLCVTHLPQIAAFADRHFLVNKREADGRTVTTLKLLDDGERAAELARIIGSDASSGAAIAHAQELINRAKSDRC